jgi:hypothetical protein
MQLPLPTVRQPHDVDRAAATAMRATAEQGRELEPVVGGGEIGGKFRGGGYIRVFPRRNVDSVDSARETVKIFPSNGFGFDGRIFGKSAPITRSSTARRQIIRI